MFSKTRRILLIPKSRTKNSRTNRSRTNKSRTAFINPFTRKTTPRWKEYNPPQNNADLALEIQRLQKAVRNQEIQNTMVWIRNHPKSNLTEYLIKTGNMNRYKTGKNRHNRPLNGYEKMWKEAQERVQNGA